MKVTVFFAWYDFWVGFFYDREKRILYFCPLPCVVVKVGFRKDERSDESQKWKIDISTDRPILTYENCSVIQDEQAEYIINLIHKDVEGE
jgi:hypothetical protein